MGHIHIGYDNPDMYTNADIVKAMDLFVGIPGVIQEPDNERKLLYGKAGAFRSQRHGCEYRSISNYYIGSEQLTKWIFNASKKAVQFVNDERLEELREDEEKVIEAINNNNKDIAKELIEKYKLELA